MMTLSQRTLPAKVAEERVPKRIRLSSSLQRLQARRDYPKQGINTITNITWIGIPSIDFQDDANGRKFSMQDHAGSDEGVRMIEADEDGHEVRIIFDDSHEPTLGGGEFRAASRLDIIGLLAVGCKCQG